MNTPTDSGLAVLVFGPPDTASLVTDIVTCALKDAGFSNTTQVNSIGEPTHTSPPCTVLEMVQRTNPELFLSPIQVYHAPSDDYEAAYASIQAEISDNKEEALVEESVSPSFYHEVVIEQLLDVIQEHEDSGEFRPVDSGFVERWNTAVEAGREALEEGGVCAIKDSVRDLQEKKDFIMGKIKDATDNIKGEELAIQYLKSVYRVLDPSISEDSITSVAAA